LGRLYPHWQMAYFRPFSNFISIKKNTSNMAIVRRWRHRVTSLHVLYVIHLRSLVTCTTYYFRLLFWK
jgi:hypothetical protein